MGWVRSLLNTVRSSPVSCTVPNRGHSTPGCDPKGPSICPKENPGSSLSKDTQGFESQCPAEISPPLQQQKNTPTSGKTYLKAPFLSSKVGVSEPCFWRKCRWRKSRTFRIEALFQSWGDLAPVPARGAQTNTSWPLRVCWAQGSEHSASMLSWGKEVLFVFFILLYLKSISSTFISLEIAFKNMLKIAWRHLAEPLASYKIIFETRDDIVCYFNKCQDAALWERGSQVLEVNASPFGNVAYDFLHSGGICGQLSGAECLSCPS